LTTSSIVILPAPAIAGASSRRLVEQPTIMSAGVGGTTSFCPIPSHTTLRDVTSSRFRIFAPAADGGSWKATAELPVCAVDAPSLRVLEGLPFDTGQNVNLMPTGGKDPCHRLHVRPDTSAAGLTGILS
jgi:hypothetical protein